MSLEDRTPERVVCAAPTHRLSFDVHVANRFVLLGPSGFQNCNELYTDRVFLGLAVMVLIGLAVDNFGFATL